MSPHLLGRHRHTPPAPASPDGPNFPSRATDASSYLSTNSHSHFLSLTRSRSRTRSHADADAAAAASAAADSDPAANPDGDSVLEVKGVRRFVRRVRSKLHDIHHHSHHHSKTASSATVDLPDAALNPAPRIALTVPDPISPRSVTSTDSALPSSPAPPKPGHNDSPRSDSDGASLHAPSVASSSASSVSPSAISSSAAPSAMSSTAASTVSLHKQGASLVDTSDTLDALSLPALASFVPLEVSDIVENKQSSNGHAVPKHAQTQLTDTQHEPTDASVHEHADASGHKQVDASDVEQIHIFDVEQPAASDNAQLTPIKERPTTPIVEQLSTPVDERLSTPVDERLIKPVDASLPVPVPVDTSTLVDDEQPNPHPINTGLPTDLNTSSDSNAPPTNPTNINVHLTDATPVDLTPVEFSPAKFTPADLTPINTTPTNVSMLHRVGSDVSNVSIIGSEVGSDASLMSSGMSNASILGSYVSWDATIIDSDTSTVTDVGATTGKEVHTGLVEDEEEERVATVKNEKPTAAENVKLAAQAEMYDVAPADSVPSCTSDDAQATLLDEEQTHYPAEAQPPLSDEELTYSPEEAPSGLLDDVQNPLPYEGQSSHDQADTPDAPSNTVDVKSNASMVGSEVSNASILGSYVSRDAAIVDSDASTVTHIGAATDDDGEPTAAENVKLAAQADMYDVAQPVAPADSVSPSTLLDEAQIHYQADLETQLPDQDPSCLPDDVQKHLPQEGQSNDDQAGTPVALVEAQANALEEVDSALEAVQPAFEAVKPTFEEATSVLEVAQPISITETHPVDLGETQPVSVDEVHTVIPEVAQPAALEGEETHMVISEEAQPAALEGEEVPTVVPEETQPATLEDEAQLAAPPIATEDSRSITPSEPQSASLEEVQPVSVGEPRPLTPDEPQAALDTIRSIVLEDAQSISARETQTATRRETQVSVPEDETYAVICEEARCVAPKETRPVIPDVSVDGAPPVALVIEDAQAGLEETHHSTDVEEVQPVSLEQVQSVIVEKACPDEVLSVGVEETRPVTPDEPQPVSFKEAQFVAPEETQSASVQKAQAGTPELHSVALVEVHYDSHEEARSSVADDAQQSTFEEAYPTTLEVPSSIPEEAQPVMEEAQLVVEEAQPVISTRENVPQGTVDEQLDILNEQPRPITPEEVQSVDVDGLITVKEQVVDETQSQSIIPDEARAVTAEQQAIELQPSALEEGQRKTFIVEYPSAVEEQPSASEPQPNALQEQSPTSNEADAIVDHKVQTIVFGEAQPGLVEVHADAPGEVHTDIFGEQFNAADELQLSPVDALTETLDKVQPCTVEVHTTALDYSGIPEVQPSAVDASDNAPLNEVHTLILEEPRTPPTEVNISHDDGPLDILEVQSSAPDDEVQQEATLDERRSLSILPTTAEVIAMPSAYPVSHEVGILEAGIHEINNIDDVDVFAETTISTPLTMVIHDLSIQEPSADDLEQSSSPVALTPDIPDPFLVDDPDDPTSDEDEGDADDVSPANLISSVTDSQQSIPASDEIALAPSTELSPPSPALEASKLLHVPPSPAASASPTSPSIQKSVPPPPESDEDEDDAPEVYLPALVAPTMFLPIPNTDPLNALLTKYISPEKRPPRDTVGDWHRSDFHALVMSNSWRALARMARDRIVSTDPEDLPLVLSLWYLRLSNLARLRLFNQTAAECTNLFTVLNTTAPPAREWIFDRVLPFELEVLNARLRYWAGDFMSYLDALSALLRRCTLKARRIADVSIAAMWRERGTRLCLIIASQLIEMKDFGGAAKLLTPMCATCPPLRSAVGRVYLQGGCVRAAAEHFATAAADPASEPSQTTMDTALLAAAEGDWPRVTTLLEGLLRDDPDNFLAVNNLSVALLSQGRLKESIQIMEDALRTSPSTVLVAEPFIFNLSTMYDLRSAAGADKKRSLLVEVAKWAGDGLRTTCLKMPTN